MAIPIRSLGQLGILTDPGPYDLPPNAFSTGINVSFQDGRIQRSPAFRVLKSSLTGATPLFCFGVPPSSGFDSIIHADSDGRLYSFSSGSSTDYSVAGFSATSDARQYTATLVANNVIINRPSHVPAYLTPTASQFVTLPGWTSTHRAVAMRTFKSFLVALNVTKASVEYPYMIKTSDASAGSIPTSWDSTNTTQLATENNLDEMTTPIVDGLGLANVFLIYTSNEVWLMEYTGSGFLFNYRRLFKDAGAINTNCVVEVNGLHYVFGPNDIYVTDGNTKKSIIKGRNSSTFYGDLNVSQKAKFFVYHDPVSETIRFCVVSGFPLCGFTGTTYCNLAAVYNYTNDTWSYEDLPNVTSATNANVDNALTWTTASGTWANTGGSWYDQQDSAKRFPVYTSVIDAANGLTSSKLVVADQPDTGVVALLVDAEATKAPYVQRVGLDLDELGLAVRDYKHIRGLIPQMRMYQPSANTRWRIGGQTLIDDTVRYSSYTNFNPRTSYKVDGKIGGRYLSYEISMTDIADFELSGFDFDAISIGKR